MSQETKNEYYEKSLDELKAHASVANLEMADIKVDIGKIYTHIDYIKTDIGEIKPKLESIEGTVQRWIGGLAVVMVVITLIMKFI